MSRKHANPLALLSDTHRGKTGNINVGEVRIICFLVASPHEKFHTTKSSSTADTDRVRSTPRLTTETLGICKG